MTDPGDGPQPGRDRGVDPEAAGVEVFDVAGALERLDDDAELLAELVEIFLDDQADRQAELAAAVAAEDLSLVTRLAHAMKGSTASLGALASSTIAARLEQVSRDGDPAETRRVFAGLERAQVRLVETLHAYLAG